MPKFSVILPAAGNSTRFLSKGRKKVFQELKGRPVWLRAAELFSNRDDVLQVLVVVSPDDLDWFKEKYAANMAFMNVEVIPGGAERSDSVLNALKKVSPEAEFVAVHDAARPLVVAEWIDEVFKAAVQTGAAILATQVTSTLKRMGQGDQVQETVSRDGLWQAQTPQVARKDWLLAAYDKRGSLQPTDEAQLLEQAGYPVRIVPGSPINFKITTPDDFRLAEVALDALPKPKLLRALHPFADEDPRFV